MCPVDPQESSGVGHITLEVTEHGAQNRITVCPGANFTITVDDVACSGGDRPL